MKHTKNIFTNVNASILLNDEMIVATRYNPTIMRAFLLNLIKKNDRKKKNNPKVILKPLTKNPTSTSNNDASANKKIFLELSEVLIRKYLDI